MYIFEKKITYFQLLNRIKFTSFTSTDRPPNVNVLI
jgi:hypothetical protein